MDEQPFDPVAAGAVAVAEPEPFDPVSHGAVPVEQPKPSIPQLAGRTAWDVIKQVTGLHQPTSLSEVAQEIFPTHFENTLVGGMLGGAKRTFEQGIAAAKTPDFSPEKFAFAGNVVGQAGGQLLGLLGLKAEPAIAKTAPTLAETAGIAKPDIAQPVEPVATDSTKTEPIITPPNEPTGISQTRIEPSERQSSEQNLTQQFANLNTQGADLQERINAQRAAQPVSEAPVSTTGSGIQETGGAAPLSIETSTEGVPNAEQVISPAQVHGDVLNPEGTQTGVREVPANVSSEGVPPRGQGETLQQTPQEVAPEVPEGAKVTLNVRNTAGELKPREMDAKQAEGMFTKEKSSYQALLNCLGA